MNTAIVCKKCVIKSTMPNVQIKGGLCSECHHRENQHPDFFKHSLEQKKSIFRNKFKKRCEKLRKEDRQYDVLVNYSGGKDSTSIIHLLKNKYKLRVLAFTVIHPFLKKETETNLEKIIQRLQVDHIKFYVNEDLWKKFIKHFALYGFNKTPAPEFLCHGCAYMHLIEGKKYAMQMRIPILASGIDSSQSLGPFWSPGSQEKKKYFSGENDYKLINETQKALGKNFKNSIYSLNFDIYRNIKWPDEIAPFTFIEYDPDKYTKILIDEGIIDSKDWLHPIKSNCNVHHLWSYLTLKRYDTHFYLRVIARALRNGIPTMLEQQFKIPFKLTREQIIKILDEYKKIVYEIFESPSLSMTKVDKLKLQLSNLSLGYLSEDMIELFFDSIISAKKDADLLGINLSLLK